MKKAIQITIGVGIILGVVWGVYELIAIIFSYLSSLSNEIATAIIAGSTTVIISVLTVVFGKFYERKLTIEKGIREKKIPTYLELVSLFFEILYSNEKLGGKISEEELIKKFSEITQGLMIWGSDDVIKAWSKFRQRAALGGEVTGSYQTMVLFEDLLKEIRKDIGYRGWGLQEGELLGLFINNIHQELEKFKNNEFR